VNADFLQPVYRADLVGVSLLVAAFASYVALDLARRVRTSDRLSAAVWTIGGALVSGSGMWSMHFGMRRLKGLRARMAQAALRWSNWAATRCRATTSRGRCRPRC
jgi:hypothetical protein